MIKINTSTFWYGIIYINSFVDEKLLFDVNET
jgi:hypothetical protein